MTENKINIAAIVTETGSEGPGRRFVIWVQGCSIKCDACCNPEMMEFNKGKWNTIDELFMLIIKSNCKGISILGGEPFDQAEPLGLLAKKVSDAGIGIMVFTGYSLNYLQNNKKKNKLLLKYTDLLKTGPYIKEAHSYKRRWIGSDNQELHFISDRYRNYPDISSEYLQSVTINMSENEEAVICGSPDLI